MSTDSAQKFDFQNDSKFGVSEAASYLKITPSTLRRLENDGKISSERLSNGYRQYSFGDVVALKQVLDEKKALKARILQSAPSLDQTSNTPPTVRNSRIWASRPSGIGPQSEKDAPGVTRQGGLTVPQIKTLRRLSYAGLAVCLILAVAVGFRFLQGDSASGKASLLTFIFSSQKDNTNARVETAQPLASVLGEETQIANYEFNVNIPAIFNRIANFKQGLTSTTATIGSLLGVATIDTITENTLEKTLDLTGDVISPAGGGLSNVKVTKINGASIGDVEPESGYVLMGDGDAWQAMSTEEITTVGEIETGTWGADLIEVGYGGTGLDTFSKGDVLYASASDTLAGLDIGTSGQVLVVQSGIPAWVDASAVSPISGSGVAGYMTYWSTGSNISYTDGLSWDDGTDSLGLTGDLAVNGGDFTSSSATFNFLSDVDTLEIAGGYTSTGCTVDGTTGDLTCTGDIGAGPGGTVGFWKRTGTELETSYAGDSVEITGGLNLAGSGISNAGTILGGTGLTSSGIITFSSLGEGIVHSSAFGQLSSSPINLTNGDITGTLPINHGGTGITGYSTGDLIVATADNVLSALGAGGEGQVFVMSDTGLPAWGSITDPGDVCPHCIIDNPNTTQTIVAQRTNITPLIIQPAVGVAADIFKVTDETGVANYIKVDKDGNVVLGEASAYGNFLVGPTGTDPIAITPVAQGDNPFTGTITSRDLTALRTWYFPNSSGDVCTSSGNCAGQSGSFGGVGIEGYLTKFDAEYTLGVSALFQDGSDNIGIGTTAPGHKLDVAGTFGVTGLSQFDSDVEIAGNVGIGVTNPASALEVSGDTDLDGDLGVTGDINASANAYVTGSVGIGTNNVGSAKLAVIGGNVGIGTTNPANFELELAGNLGPSANNTYSIGKTTNTGVIDQDLSNADASFIGEDSSDRSGMDISEVGDVNGDGYDDFVIGAPFDEEKASNAGQTYLILGKASGWAMDTGLSSANASFRGEDSNDYSGISVSGVGDVNGDGYDDFAIGATGDEEGGSASGQTYLILGKASGWAMDTDLSAADASFWGEDSSDISGGDISGVGDVNGDGYDDFVIGASGDEEGGSNSGQTYLILGKASGWAMDTDLSAADASFWGEDSDDRSGTAISGVGDVNDDGYDDFVIGAYGDEDGGGAEAGQAYLILGKASGWAMDTDLSAADASFWGEEIGDRFGKSVAGAGDVNGDGYDDFVIGATFSDVGGSNAGQIYLILGKASGWAMDTDSSSADASFWGELAGDDADKVSGAGDVNGDGYDDFVIGADLNDEGGSNSGQTYLILGKASGWAMDTDLSAADASFWGEDSDDYSGYEVCSGDFNGDGLSDLIMSAPMDEEGGTQAGQIYLVLSHPMQFNSILARHFNSDTLSVGLLDFQGDTIASTSRLNLDARRVNVLGSLTALGAVGIGTTAPAEALEIGGTGTIRIGGLTASRGVYTDANKNLTSTPPTSGILGYWQRNSTYLSPATITDFIGIGTTAPASLLSLYSASTATTFQGFDLDWQPSSATTLAGDLFKINIGSLGEASNLFNILDNTSSLFSVSETQINSNLPHAFNAAGDVSMAYDLIMENQTAAAIKSYGPFNIEAGETWESNNLVLRTFNQGSVLVDYSDTSTTANTHTALQVSPIVSGAITTGTRAIYGVYNNPQSVAANSGGTTNLYGNYLLPSSTLATAGTTNVYGSYVSSTATHAADAGTINQYGLYVANGTSSTNGTSKKYGLYVEAPTGADTNYAAIFAGGNVGIGVTNPSLRLEVSSDSGTTRTFMDASSSVGYMGTLTNHPLMLQTNNQNKLMISADGNVWAGGSTADVSPVIAIQASGRVGIGTTAPAEALEIGGSGNVRIGGLTASSGVYTDASKTLTSTPPTTGTLGFWTRSGTTLVPSTAGDIIATTGSIGIGTTAPSSILHTVASGAKTADYIGNYLTNVATSSTASVTKTGLSVTSTGTWNGTTAVNRGLYVNATGGTTNYAAIFEGGNVGIGTTAPGAALEIAGQIKITGGTPGAGKILVSDENGLASWSTVGGAGGISGGGTLNYLAKFTPSGTAVGNSLLYDTGTNLGIGTTAPGATMEINAGSAATIGLLVKGYTGQTANLQNWTNSSGTVLAGIDSAGALSVNNADPPLYTNTGGTGDRRTIITATSSEGLFFASNATGLINGAVGNAHLRGSVAVAGHYIKFDFGAGNAKRIIEAKLFQPVAQANGTWKWQGSNDDSVWTDIGGSFILGNALEQTMIELASNVNIYRYYRLYGVSGTTYTGGAGYSTVSELEFKLSTTAGGSSILASASLGVGTLSPTSALDVIGEARTYKYAFGDQTGVYLDTLGTNILSLATDNANRLVIDASGKVGIGTTAPSSTLEIAGDVELANYLYFGNATSEYLRWDASDFLLSDDLLPSATLTYNLGSDTARWADSFIGPATLHIGSSITDEGTLSYNTDLNILNIATDSTTNGDISFFTDDLYLDKATGRVGIGTTSPTVKLEVVGDIRSKLSQGGVALHALNPDTPEDGSKLNSPALRFTGVYDSNAGFELVTRSERYADIIFYPQSQADTNEYMAFMPNSVPVMTVHTSGRVGIGTTAPALALDVVGSARFSAVGSEGMANDLRITADGTLTTNTSDASMKTNVEPLADDTLDKLLQLEPVSFNWKENPDGAKDIGFIAQEVDPVFPELTFTNSADGKMGINYSKFSAILVKAIQEQQAQINKISALSTVAGLNGDLDELKQTVGGVQTDLATARADIKALKASIADMTKESTESTQSSASPLAIDADLLASIQKVYDDFKEFAAALGLTKDDDGLVISTNLNVLGDATMRDLNVTGNIRAGLLKIDTLNNELNLLGPSCYSEASGELNTDLCQTQTIYLQKNLAGNVDVFAGKIVFDPAGNMAIAGDIQLAGVIKGGASIRGSETIKVGESQVEIQMDWKDTPASVVVTPSANMQVWVTELTNDGFTIKSAADVAEDLQVYWVAIW